MHRRDFELIAEAICRLPDRDARLAMVRAMVPIFRRLNPQFQELRFRSACNAVEYGDVSGNLFPDNPPR